MSAASLNDIAKTAMHSQGKGPFLPLCFSELSPYYLRLASNSGKDPLIGMEMRIGTQT